MLSFSLLSISVSDAAEQALWTCMVDNPQHLFVPLLDQFNTIYRLTKEMKKAEVEHMLVCELIAYLGSAWNQWEGLFDN